MSTLLLVTTTFETVSAIVPGILDQFWKFYIEHVLFKAICIHIIMF
jgi:hypothetical protein